MIALGFIWPLFAWMMVGIVSFGIGVVIVNNEWHRVFSFDLEDFEDNVYKILVVVFWPLLWFYGLFVGLMKLMELGVKSIKRLGDKDGEEE
jgi:hypothetical protein